MFDKNARAAVEHVRCRLEALIHSKEGTANLCVTKTWREYYQAQGVGLMAALDEVVSVLSAIDLDTQEQEYNERKRLKDGRELD